MRSAALAMVLCLAFAQACASKPECQDNPALPSAAVKAGSPLAGVETQEARIVVYPDPAEDWRKLVNLAVFEGFRPGISIDEARRTHGQPAAESEEGGDTRWIYDRPAGRVRITREHQSSLPFVVFLKRWILAGYPRQGSPADVLHPAILGHLPSGKPGIDVTIMNNCGYPGANVLIRNGVVMQMNWLDTPGSSPSGLAPTKEN